MIGQLRIYTINKAMMDSWLEVFQAECVPHLEEAGISVHSMWVTEDRTQFTWIRCFPDKSQIEPLEAAFYGTDWWNGRVDYIRSHIARTDITLVEPV